MMENYKIRLTDHAIEHMQQTTTYISNVLLSPETARNWLANMKKEIRSLSQLPRRFPLVDEEPWHSDGIRKLIANNYFVYFYIDENSYEVWVIAVVYSGMDQTTQLRNVTG